MLTSARQGHFEIAQDVPHLALLAAEWLAARIAEKTGVFRLALAGGATPRPLYARLAANPFHHDIDWARVEFFWGDERMVPHDDPRSNFRMAREMLLGQIPASPERVHPMPTDGEPEDCAARYEAFLKSHFQGKAFDPANPFFDVLLLGLGADGHTASLLPGEPVLHETRHWVAAVPHGAPEPRLTLTYPAIQSSRHIAFLVAGAEKAEAVAGVRAGDTNLPAARVHSGGEIRWFIDRAAAGAI